MISIQHDSLNSNDVININNIIYSLNTSRPSKSLLDCNLYQDYSKIDKKLNIINEYSYLNIQNIQNTKYVLKEIMNKLKFFKHSNEENVVNHYFNNLNIQYDTLLIYDIEFQECNRTIIFSFEKTLKFKKIIEDIIYLVNILKTDDYLILNYIDVFTNLSLEYLILLSNIFTKIKLFYCKILKQNILICEKYFINENVIKYIKNINYKKNINQFGLNICPKLQNNITEYNTNIFNYYINIFSKINKYNLLDEKEYIFKNYSKRIGILKNGSILDCNHTFKECYIYDCLICTKCYDLYNFC